MSRQARLFFGLAAVFALLAVGAGAFGAHSPRARVGPELLAVFETGVRYQMYHALALVAVARAADIRPARTVALAGWLFVAGILLFSGSLYALVFSGVRGLGAVTPFGGLSFLAGWACLAAWAIGTPPNPAIGQAPAARPSASASPPPRR